MAMLTEQQAKALVDKIISYSKSDEISVSVNGGREGNIRFARNTVTTNGEADDLTISITSVFGKRSGSTTVNETSDEALEKAVRRSEEIAQLAPENPEWITGNGPMKYGQAKNYADNLARINPEFRVDEVLLSIDNCVKKKMTAAGFMQDNASCVAIGNSKGLFAYNRSTNGSFSITARTADEKGSGYAVSYFTDLSDLKARRATETAINKAITSKEAKEMKPEKYTVILEPQAAYDLLSLLIGAMDARSADEGRSFFGKRGSGNRIGEKLFDESVTIFSDPFNVENPGIPFSNDGTPRQNTVWIENGVLKNLPYSRYWAKQKNVEPVPQPAGAIMKGTDQSLEDMIKSSDKAILVTRFWYIRSVDPQTLVYTGLTRDGTFYIENGSIKHAIKNFRFNESPAIMLNNLEAIGKPVRIANSLVPPLKIRDFNFTSLSDAV